MNGDAIQGFSSGLVKRQADAPAARWSDLWKVNLAPRGYELVFWLFGLITVVLTSGTPLPFSTGLGLVFLSKAAQWTGLVMALSVPVVGYRALRHGLRHGRESLKEKETIMGLIQPYWTLDFALLTFRRCVAILGVIYFFLHLKSVILLINKANYDLFFWNLDRWLHLGVQPNIYLMESFGQDKAVAVALDWLYFKYFTYTLLASMVFLLEIKGRRLAEKYFLAYALLWAAGGLGYIAAPADGPCYAILAQYSTPKEHRVHMFQFPVDMDIPRDYARSYVESRIWIAKTYQERLWESRKKFLAGESLPGMFYGIAAMPSLHVAAVTLIMIFFFMVSPILGALGAIYTAIVFIGSVFLQWHYAVDGYAGALMAALIWRVSVSGLPWARGGGKGMDTKPESP
ncbi:MAG: phosphatase PAP2 family protein [Candidatus Nitrospinota bacterium M3_3B_026]